ncbi:MAG: DUF1521 domain-containing protein [bacterium]
MTGIAANDLSNSMMALRLIKMAKHAEDRRNGKKVDDKSALEYFKEDQAIISQTAIEAKQQDQLNIDAIVNNNNQTESTRTQAQNIEKTTPITDSDQVDLSLRASLKVETELILSFSSSPAIDGLKVHNKNLAESDRYLFIFKDGSTFTILDKWANKSTTVWGDPHIDVDDVDGNNDGDFNQLKSSDEYTTFKLGDGTRLTFTAKDDGIIEKVDIYKGSQHVTGIGQAGIEFSSESSLFSTTIKSDGSIAAFAEPMGDVVFSGGDGNDWFDANNKLIWGKTTGPVITQRPATVLEINYKQTITQTISIQTISRNA